MFSWYYLYTHLMRSCIWPQLRFSFHFLWGAKETTDHTCHKNWSKEIIWAIWICRFTTTHLICIELRMLLESQLRGKWMVILSLASVNTGLLRLLPMTPNPCCTTVTQVSVPTASVFLTELIRGLYNPDKPSGIRAGKVVPYTREWWALF